MRALRSRLGFSLLEVVIVGGLFSAILLAVSQAMIGNQMQIKRLDLAMTLQKIPSLVMTALSGNIGNQVFVTFATDTTPYPTSFSSQMPPLKPVALRKLAERVCPGIGGEIDFVQKPSQGNQFDAIYFGGPQFIRNLNLTDASVRVSDLRLVQMGSAEFPGGNCPPPDFCQNQRCSFMVVIDLAPTTGGAVTLGGNRRITVPIACTTNQQGSVEYLDSCVFVGGTSVLPSPSGSPSPSPSPSPSVTCLPNVDVNEDTVVDDFDIEITKSLIGFVPTTPGGGTYKNYNLFNDNGTGSHQTSWMPSGVPAPRPATIASYSADARAFIKKLDQNGDDKVDQLDIDKIEETRDLIDSKQCAPNLTKKCLDATAMGKLVPYAAALAAPTAVIDGADVGQLDGCIGSDLVIPAGPAYPLGYNCPAMNLDAECNRVPGATPNPNPTPDSTGWCKVSNTSATSVRGSDWGYYPVSQRDLVLLNLLWKNQLLKARFLKSCSNTKPNLYPQVPGLPDVVLPGGGGGGGTGPEFVK